VEPRQTGKAAVDAAGLGICWCAMTESGSGAVLLLNHENINETRTNTEMVGAAGFEPTTSTV